MRLPLAVTVAADSKTANSTAVNAFRRHVDVHLPGIFVSQETILRHASSTFLARDEALAMVHLLLDRHIQTLLRRLLLRLLSAEGLVEAVVAAILNFAVAVAAGGILTTAICSEETVLLRYPAGQEMAETLGTPEMSETSHARHVSLRDETRDALKDGMKTVGQSGLNASARLTGRGESLLNPASKTGHLMTLSPVEHHIRHQLLM